ncbi:MAG: ABC-F family ATP-binding cassette domain-containing protein [Deltaproteobacteria bacterium]|nr:ABC-F family ATP-binding cassette domain-containing protein [Deltaproteobacteria bacterium]
MIYLKDLSLSFGGQVIYEGINWTITERSRIGLVGENGTGKTTLFRTIMGMVPLDAGSVEIPNRKNKTIGYLPQDLVELEPVGLMEYLKKKSGLADIEGQIKELEGAISRCAEGSAEFKRVTKAYEQAVARFNAKDGYAFEAKSRQILKGLGFRERDFAKNCAEFSGGWKMRVLFAVILLSEPDMMLLDEPTNHLDTESMEWLESYLKDYKGTIIAVAHDRFFLDKIVNQIADLANRRITIYRGNYSHYLVEKDKGLEALKKEMELQKGEIKRIEAFIERFRYKATKAKQVQSRIRMLEKYDLVRTDPNAKSIRIQFPEGMKSGKEVLAVDNIVKSYGETDVLKGLSFSVHRGDKIALVGMNGAGKSTLTRLLSGTETPDAGQVKVGLHVNMAFFSQESAENLNYDKTVWEEISQAGVKANDQEKRNLLGAFLFSGDDIHKSISVLSGGEKSRLALLKILLQDSNLLILDEPTNHLDLKTKDIFQDALLQYHGTVILVSHDRYFLDRLVNRVIEIRDGTCREYLGNYSYFIEKRRSETMENTTETNAVSEKIKTADAAAGSGRKTKADKRLEAEERNRISRMTRGIRKELAAVEERIAVLEKHKTQNETLLCEPDIHKNPQRIKTLDQELKEISIDLERLYLEWDELSLKLEAFESPDHS